MDYVENFKSIITGESQDDFHDIYIDKDFLEIKFSKNVFNVNSTFSTF